MTNTLNISNTSSSNLAGTISDYSVDPKVLDSPSGDEISYVNPDAAKQIGYFSKNPDLKAAIISKAIWVVGKGYTTDNRTKIVLDFIKGWGKDTFDDILFNMELSRRIYGDAFAEIIRDPETDELLNIKPLNAANIKIVCNKSGQIIRYEQLNAGEPIKFKPEEILHLSNNRICDQIHGTSDIEAVESTLLAEMESFEDTKKIMHRQARPMILWKLGTDDATKIAAFATKMDNATRQGENLYIPDDANSVNAEVVQLNPSPLVLSWRNDIRSKFYRSIGLPELMTDSNGASESGGKIGYLAFEQITEREQRYWELQLEAQLNIKINLIPPASLAQELQDDNAKDGQGFQPNDVQAGVGQ